MSAPDGSPRGPEQLPDQLVEALDALETPGLRAVRAYVDRRLASGQTPPVERVRAEADGEVLDVDDRGVYTLVRKRPESDRETVSLYRVRLAEPLDGEEALHWSFLGDVREPVCGNCGSALEDRSDSCPDCGEPAAGGDDGR